MPPTQTLHLYIANKNYSSWSMRPWVLMRHFGIAFEEHTLRFDGYGPETQFKQSLKQLAAAVSVPVLRLAPHPQPHHTPPQPLVIQDSLAIVECVAELFPTHPIWPPDFVARCMARSACAQMHAGFSTLRQCFPMNIEAHLPHVWPEQAQQHPQVKTELAHLHALWQSLLDRFQGPMLMGSFSAVDAYFAPMVMRHLSYGWPCHADIARYLQAVYAVPAVQEWVQAALLERDFLAFNEPYRQAPTLASPERT